MKSLRTLLLASMAFGCMFYITPHSENSVSHSDAISGGAYATFAGKFGGNITTHDLNKTTEVDVAGCVEGSKIYKFELTIYSAAKTITYKGSSHKFTSDMLTTFKSLKKGDSFEFKRIRAKLPSGEGIDVVGRKFYII